jgi:hypothetical protein
LIAGPRALLGVLVKDWPRFRKAISSPGTDWLRLCNRYERIKPAPDGIGVHCDWEWTSVLHAPTVLPSLGRRLFTRALAEYPFAMAERPEYDPENGPVQVSFVIGHRGMDRLPHLLATLRTIAAQRRVRSECIVVEQSTTREVRSCLPEWVRYVHTPLPDPNMPYCRSWAFNVGARMARGEVLILHDNDLLAPREYAHEHWRLLREGWEVVNLKRFLFYLSPADTRRLFKEGDSLTFKEPPESILQNTEGGGSLAIARETYFAIGGFDEEFIGWGGEDNELWDRALTRRVYPFGYLPLIHLWHPPQPDKGAVRGQGLHTAGLFERRLALAPEMRIKELNRRNQGNPQAPSRRSSGPVGLEVISQRAVSVGD